MTRAWCTTKEVGKEKSRPPPTKRSLIGHGLRPKRANRARFKSANPTATLYVGTPRLPTIAPRSPLAGKSLSNKTMRRQRDNPTSSHIQESLPNFRSKSQPPGCKSSPTIRLGSARFLSISTTRRPWRAIVAAAAQPAIPAPTTITSTPVETGRPARDE